MPTRLVGKKILQKNGFNVIEVSDSRDAIKLFIKYLPEILLLDVIMPDVNGFEICEQIRQLPQGQDTLILMLTGLDDVDSINKAYDLGATDFVTKPINWQILIYRLRYMLRAKSTTLLLKSEQKKLRNAQIIAQLSHWEWDLTTNTFMWSDYAANVLRVEPEQLNNFHDFVTLIHPGDKKSFVEKFYQIQKERCPWQGECRVVCHDNTELIIQQYVEFMNNEQGHIAMMGAIQDITQLRQYEKTINYIKNYDSVTQLPNQYYFEKNAYQWLDDTYDNEKQAALIAIDIDKLRLVKESLGTDASNTLLKKLTIRFNEVIDEYIHSSALTLDESKIVLGRLVNEEFVILIYKIADIDKVMSLVQALLNVAQQIFYFKKNEINTTLSIGISVFPEDGSTFHDLLKNANSAMYYAKKDGGNDFKFYSLGAHLQSMKRLSIETNLRKGLKKRQFELYLQPRFSPVSIEACAAEVLLRWNHPTLGYVPPLEFIPVAEDTGLIIDIGNWVLDETIKHMSLWWSANKTLLPISINISMHQFNRSPLVEIIANLIQTYQIPASLLELEITETALMCDVEKTRHMLSELKQLGVKLAIDDFGTGYSSLGYLKSFPIDRIKIDKCFVTDLITNQDNQLITKAIINLAHNLNLAVTAEGVETQAQLDYLCDHNCDEFQGFLFSKPMPLSAFEDSVIFKRHPIEVQYITQSLANNNNNLRK
ncbi:MAG: EAL domain-containing protein [Gammaproteobacteria bacterium]